MTDRDSASSHHGVVQQASAEDGHPNETMRLLFDRASCRNYAQRPIPADVMRRVLEAGIHAPSGGNLQPFSIVQIEDQATREGLASRCGQSFIGRAPVLLLFCIDLHRLQRWARLRVAPFTAHHSFRHFWIAFQDTIICAQNVCTAADAMGLGSCYIGTSMESIANLRQMLALPEGVLPVVLLCLGYPKARPSPRRKLDVDVIVHHERYREMSDEELVDAYETKYPGVRVEATEERMEALFEVCQEAHGEAFARRCIEQVEGDGYINAVQRYFGLHYRANTMPLGNEEFLRTLREAGLYCFEAYQPPVDEPA